MLNGFVKNTIRNVKEFLINVKNWIISNDFRKMLQHVAMMSSLFIVIMITINFLVGENPLYVKVIVGIFGSIGTVSYREYIKKQDAKKQAKKDIETKIREIKKDIKGIKLLMSKNHLESGLLLVPLLMSEIEKLISDIKTTEINSSEESILKDIEEELEDVSNERDLNKIISIISSIFKELTGLIKEK